MMTDQQEIALLNFYRASELHGGLILGQLARRVRDPQLMLELTRHAAEEMGHAQLWTETMLTLGMRPSPVKETYQTRYAAALGSPITMIEVLALTQVFERRVYRHFAEHLHRPNTYDAVKATLRRMLEEEKGHLAWVKRWLDAEAATKPELVRDTMARYAAADACIYETLRAEYGWERAA
ncbi:MAG: ferritin-like domain-containing protein [Gemmatimonadota bacterium]|nr:ferritin-like domain-containing protein [Gemmatimonadota bacterium]